MAQLQTRDPGSPESIHLTPLRSVRIGKALAAILALSFAILSLLVWLIIRTEKRKCRGSRDRASGYGHPDQVESRQAQA